MYQHPGVYVEEVPSSSRPIESASTSTALMVGYAVKGPLKKPTLILSFDQYVNVFGGINDFHDMTPNVDHMGHAAKAFFQNGGSKAYVVRLAGTHPTETDKKLTAGSAKLFVPAAAGVTKYYALSAVNQGIWSNGITVTATETVAAVNNKPARFDVSISIPDSSEKMRVAESYNDVTLAHDDAVDFFGIHLNQRSAILHVDEGAPKTDLTDEDTKIFKIGTLTSGSLAGLAGDDLVALNNKGMTVEGQAVLLSPVTVSTRLADIAVMIESAVTTGAATAEPRSKFRCVAKDGKLVLQSGERSDTSKVDIVAPATPADSCIAKLKLDAADPSQEAVAVLGEATFKAKFAKSTTATLSDGRDGMLPTISEYGDTELQNKLRKIRDISIITLPGQAWSDAGIEAKANIQEFQAHAERMKNRMVIVDPDPALEFTSSNSFLDHGFPTSTYTCAYYPWVEVANPHYHPDLRPNRKKTVLVAPSGFAAGLWSRTDSRRGVWKAPAGLQASLLGIARTVRQIGDDEQDQLNPVGINCLRRIISDTVIWGTRTLATKADPEWRYIPVRRTAMMIEESIYQGIQWAVFEPNDHRLWGSLRLNIENFMNGLFRAGAFQGEKASDAYFVRCALNDTMTQGDIDAGQVIVLVGFAPVKPAEFVIVRLQQIVGQQ
jgi:uncharacterized protein